MSETGSSFLEGLFAERFPTFACLRCGHGNFLIVSPLSQTHFDDDGGEVKDATALNVLSKLRKIQSSGVMQIHEQLTWSLAEYYYATLVCERCGFAEKHYIPILIQMSETVAETLNES